MRKTSYDLDIPKCVENTGNAYELVIYTALKARQKIKADPVTYTTGGRAIVDTLHEIQAGSKIN